MTAQEELAEAGAGGSRDENCARAIVRAKMLFSLPKSGPPERESRPAV